MDFKLGVLHAKSKILNWIVSAEWTHYRVQSKMKWDVVRALAPTKFMTTPRHEKTNVLGSDLVRHKPRCKATEDSKKLEISDFESRGIVLSM